MRSGRVCCSLKTEEPEKRGCGPSHVRGPGRSSARRTSLRPQGERCVRCGARERSLLSRAPGLRQHRSQTKVCREDEDGESGTLDPRNSSKSREFDSYAGHGAARRPFQEPGRPRGSDVRRMSERLDLERKCTSGALDPYRVQSRPIASRRGPHRVQRGSTSRPTASKGVRIASQRRPACGNAGASGPPQGRLTPAAPARSSPGPGRTPR